LPARQTRDYADGGATNHSFDDPMNVVQFSGKAGDQREVVLTGAVVNDPGTHDVQAWCTSSRTSDAEIALTAGNLTAVAAPVERVSETRALPARRRGCRARTAPSPSGQ
jgi:hypothetical protein